MACASCFNCALGFASASSSSARPPRVGTVHVAGSRRVGAKHFRDKDWGCSVHCSAGCRGCQIPWSRSCLVGAMMFAHEVSRLRTRHRQRRSIKAHGRTSVLDALACRCGTLQQCVDVPEQSTDVDPKDDRLRCRWCSQTFPSRSQLFLHLRSSEACLSAAESEDPGAATQLMPIRGRRLNVVFKVAYLRNGDAAQKLIAEMLSSAGARDIESSRASDDEARGKGLPFGLDNRILQQEETCGASGDIVTARFSAACTGSLFVERLCESVRHRRVVADDAGVRILDFRLLPPGETLHAEACCTRRVYHYLLPYWAIDPDFPLSPSSASTASVNQLTRLSTTPELRASLQRFKASLRSALQGIETNSGAEPLEAKVAGAEGADLEQGTSGRFQRFAGKKLHASETRRQCRWHNFAPAQFAGSLSPSRDSVLCALDRVKHAETLDLRGQAFAVIQLAGDHFLVQQCQKLVAVVLCIHRGWLPSDFLGIALRSDVVVSTPTAPSEFLYLSGCHYAIWSRYHGRLFDRTWTSRTNQPRDGICVEGFPSIDVFGEEPQAAQQAWRHKILDKMAALETCDDSPSIVAAWLHDLEHKQVPRIREELALIAKMDAFAAGGPGSAPVPRPLSAAREFSDDCPEAYREVLLLLQDIWHSGRWPATSPARARVVRSGDGGTFSVGHVQPGQRPPAGNELFPELTEAVFRLERAIAPEGRPPSRMVAINCNAMFAPHTDAGAGAGQSTSLIVGLGQYVGGELAVEGVINDIRYKPLEFDGWRQRHWTLGWQGERFSLVWFTPA